MFCLLDFLCTPRGEECKVEPGPPPSVRRETWDRTGIGVLELSSELWRIARCELPSKPRVYSSNNSGNSSSSSSS